MLGMRSSDVSVGKEDDNKKPNNGAEKYVET